MKGKIFFVFVISMLLYVSFSTSAINIHFNCNQNVITETNTNNNDADLPVWTVGDSWTYDMVIDGQQGTSLNFDLTINNLKLVVVEVTDETYKVSMDVPSGDVRGSGGVNFDILTLSGNLINTKLNGEILVNISTLEIIYTEGTIDGAIDKIVDIPFTIDFNLGFYNESLNQTNYSSLQFPMNVFDGWIIPFMFIIVEMHLSLLDDPSYTYMFTDVHYMLCEGWETLTVDSKEYDALFITGDNAVKAEIYYSPAAGNLIKLDYKDLDLGYGSKINSFEMTLKSTTFEVVSNPPIKPTSIQGPIDMFVGETGSYETSSTDPDGDEIRYFIDWGDGTTFTSDFLPSGVMQSFEHKWTSKGSFDVKVKARDKYGKESSWSDPLSVNVDNNAPEKPQRPQGPVRGNYRDTHTYTTSSIDPDGHRIRYLFDWGDGSTTWSEYYDSGQTASVSHKWSLQGTYEIKVKAQDEYGEESEWSDPLSIIVPKFKLIQRLDFLHKIINYFPYFQKIITIINME